MTVTIIDFQQQHHRADRIGKSWELAIETFLNHCRAKNLRPRTIEWYQEVLQNYFLRDFVQKQLANKSPAEFYTEDVERYIVFMSQRGISVETANIRLRALRAFWNFMYENGYIDHKVKVKLIKGDKKIIKTFSETDVKKLVERPKNLESFAELRDWAMVCFLIGTGVRLGTLIELRIGDIDFVAREIRLRHTKNREEQIIPLSLSLSRILQEYLKIRGGQPEDYLFCNTYGEKLQPRTVDDRIKKYCTERLGDRKQRGMRYSAHDFRHTFAIFYIRNGGDILSLQKLLGHKTLEMTRRYVNMLLGDVKRQFLKYSPLDNLATVRASGRKAIRLPKEQKE